MRVFGDFFFFFISLICVFLSVFVIAVINPIYSILFLVSLFACMTVLFAFIEVYFLALVLLIVYLGAVGVLFLFIVMMLNVKILELKRNINFVPFLFILLLLFFLFFHFFLDFAGVHESYIGIFYRYNDFFQGILKSNGKLFLYFYYQNSSIENLGLVLYTFFFFQFLLAGIILFVAILGAIFLTLEEGKFSKKQNVFFQLLRVKKIFKNEIS